MTFETIDIQCRRAAADARQPGENCVCRIAEQYQIEALRQRSERRQASVRECVEIFVPDGWYVNQLHAAVAIAAVAFAAIDSYIVSPLHKPDRQLFRKCFKATVVCRNAASSQQGNPHTLRQLRPHEPAHTLRSLILALHSVGDAAGDIGARVFRRGSQGAIVSRGRRNLTALLPVERHAHTNFVLLFAEGGKDDERDKRQYENDDDKGGLLQNVPS